MPIETITNETDLESAGFYWRERDGVRALICGPLESAGFANAFSTRFGGVSPMPSGALNLAGFNEDTAENIHENRRRFLNLLNGAWTLTSCWQVHGSAIRLVRNLADARNDTENCDALTTRTAGILLGVKTADCVPLLLADERTGAVAAVHAGWRGSVAGIVPQTLARMNQEYDTCPEDVRVAIGPAANGCCYEVGTEVIEVFRERLPGLDRLIRPTRPGHALIDLQGANSGLLSAAGVTPEKIHIAPFCTICRNDLFFSYRREKVAQGRVGRLMAVVGPRT
ncbi:MAG: peptidoglycan editing factor PgeF [Pyrinomonadaceae bacterium]